MTLLLFVGGLVALVAGASLLVRGASRLALCLVLSPLVVGMSALITPRGVHRQVIRQEARS